MSVAIIHLACQFSAATSKNKMSLNNSYWLNSLRSAEITSFRHMQKKTQITFTIISPRSENYSGVVIGHDTFSVRSLLSFLFPFYSEANHRSNIQKGRRKNSQIVIHFATKIVSGGVYCQHVSQINIKHVCFTLFFLFSCKEMGDMFRLEKEEWSFDTQQKVFSWYLHIKNVQT